MIHGPWGTQCKKEGKCSKNFPKAYREETIIGENNDPYCRRRCTNKTYKKSTEFNIDNHFVVPYNPFLLIKLNCHINIDVVSNIAAVKYIYINIFMQVMTKHLLQ